MAIHPDDPPWSIFGLPRIVGNMKQLRRLTEHVDSPANGITFCSGSLGADRTMISFAIINHFGSRQKLHFAHTRNILRTGPRSFQESSPISLRMVPSIWCVYWKRSGKPGLTDRFVQTTGE